MARCRDAPCAGNQGRYCATTADYSRVAITPGNARGIWRVSRSNRLDLARREAAQFIGHLSEATYIHLVSWPVQSYCSSIRTLNGCGAIASRGALLRLRTVSGERSAARMICSMLEQAIIADPTALAHGDIEGAGLEVLRLLEQRPDMSQRELSNALGLSLGKTHYVLHALVDKGLLKVRNFRRSGNKLAYAYVLTPTGLSEKLRLTKAFLKRKEAEFEALRRSIAALRSELTEGSN